MNQELVCNKYCPRNPGTTTKVNAEGIKVGSTGMAIKGALLSNCHAMNCEPHVTKYPISCPVQCLALGQCSIPS